MSETPSAEKDAGQRPEFTAFLDRVLENPEARAAFDRAELRHLTYGLDRRQARRVRRRYYGTTEKGGSRG